MNAQKKLQSIKCTSHVDSCIWKWENGCEWEYILIKTQNLLITVHRDIIYFHFYGRKIVIVYSIQSSKFSFFNWKLIQDLINDESCEMWCFCFFLFWNRIFTIYNYSHTHMKVYYYNNNKYHIKFTFILNKNVPNWENCS